MRILIEVNGGCIQQVYVDPDHVGELELWTNDSDCREQGDDGLMEVGYVVVGSERFDDCLKEARQEDKDNLADGVVGCDCGCHPHDGTPPFSTEEIANASCEPDDDSPEPSSRMASDGSGF